MGAIEDLDRKIMDVNARLQNVLTFVRAMGAWVISPTELANADRTVMLRGAGNLAFGDPPPTAADAGTGIFLDATGLYGLNANTQEFYVRATDGKGVFGAGAGVISSAGLNITGVGAKALLGHTVSSFANSILEVAEATSNAYRGVAMIQRTADAVGMPISLVKSRNPTPGSFTAVTTDDVLGFIDYAGDDGTALVGGGRVSAVATQAWTASARGTKISIDVTANGATSRTAALVLGQDASAQFGGGSVITQTAALATTATTGHLYIPTSAGTPTGVPAGFTGTVAFQYDTTGNRLWVYNGAWRSILLA
ncbi:MAG: hypothetical protein Q8Q14_01895 [Gemmatimonadales bacterium]|nr:hypothetical protein [Gemmatimonadales bacterium]